MLGHIVSTHGDINHNLYVGKIPNNNHSLISDFKSPQDFPLVAMCA